MKALMILALVLVTGCSAVKPISGPTGEPTSEPRVIGEATTEDLIAAPGEVTANQLYASSVFNFYMITGNRQAATAWAHIIQACVKDEQKDACVFANQVMQAVDVCREVAMGNGEDWGILYDEVYPTLTIDTMECTIRLLKGDTHL